MTILMQHILTLNKFNIRHFIQTKRCTLGTVAVPSCAIIFIDKIEKFVHGNLEWLVTRRTPWPYAKVWTSASKQAISNSDHAITFFFGQIPFRYESLYPTSFELNSTTAVLLQGWLWYKITHEVWYAIEQRNQELLSLLRKIHWWHIYQIHKRRSKTEWFPNQLTYDAQLNQIRLRKVNPINCILVYIVTNRQQIILSTKPTNTHTTISIIVLTANN